jgi:cytochrome P450
VPLSEVPWFRSYAEAVEVLRSPRFSAAVHHRKSYPVFGGVVLSLHGAEHMMRRRAEQSLFSRSALERYERDYLIPTFDASLKAVQELAGDADSVEVDLVQLVQLALLRMTAALVGIDGIETDEDALRLRQIGVVLGTAVSVEYSTRDVNEVIAEALTVKAEFIERYFLPAWQRRKALLDTAGPHDSETEDSASPTDLMTILMQTYPDWDQDDFVRECLFFVTASSNTTTNAAPHAFGELARWFGDHPEDRDRISDTKFMQNAVAEAIRLHPAIPWIIRRANADVQLTNGPLIPAGDLAVVDTNAANRDVNAFGPDADQFNPHRTVSGSVQRFGFAFAGGPHMCPGRPVAIGGVTRADEENVGALVLMLQRLFEVGARLGDEPPTVRPDMQDVRYSRYPVRIPVPLTASV